MNETNIVKETCAALGVNFKELAFIMKVNEGTPAQWSSKNNAPDMAVEFMRTLIEHKQDKEQLAKIKAALTTIKEI